MKLTRPTRSLAAAATLSLLTALTLAGCSSAEAPGDADGDVELVIWTFLSREGTSPREVVLDDLIAKFEKAHPGVTVSVEAQPFEELESKFITASQRGDAPDLIWARDTFLSLLDEAGSLLDLDDQLSEEFTSEALPDMFDVFTDKAVFDARRVALPLWPTPAQTIFYRSDVLQAAGYEAPPLNWDEMLDALGSLTSGNQFGLGLPTNDTGVTPFLMLLNGFEDEVFDQKTGRFDLLGEESIQVAETLRALGASGDVPADAISSTGQDVQDQFASGRFAMAMAFGPRFSAYQESAAGYDASTLRVSAWPSFDSDNPSALLGPYWNVGISAETEHPDEATALLESLYTVDASAQWAEVAGQVPDRRSVLSDPFFETDQGKVIVDFVEIIDADGARVLPQKLEDVTQLANVLNGATQRLLGTDEDVEKILSDAKAELGW